MFIIAKVKLSALERDALKETANVGCGNASIALSEVIDRRVNLAVSEIEILPLKDLPKLLGGTKQVVGIYTPIHEGMTGNVLLILKRENAVELAGIIQSAERKGKELTKNDEKSLRTVGNIISEYYIKSLNRFLDMKIKPENTSILSTLSNSIAEIISVNLDRKTEDILLLSTRFKVEKTNIEGNYILCLGMESLEQTLKAIRKNFQD